MSRSSHHQRQLQLQQQQQQMAENDAAALAAEIFDHFCVATTMRQTLGLYRNMCDTLKLRPGPLNEFYPKLKAKIRSWKAQALWKKFDARASHRVYNKGNACTGTRVLVIGAGPCGLRTAIEAQLLGAKVVVVEKRDRISRNNVLHLWPFVITDLRNLGAKKFYGKFCAGSIDHISIRQLQCILLKVALLLGVEVHEGVSFLNTIEPSDGCGWRAQISPEDHAVSHYEFDVLIGADGKRNTLEGFKRKEFRGKLAIAITANFINKKTEAEAKAEEISGVAFIFNQSFFKELYQTTGIDLENIVYYKDETHYFVMTAKKHSLIDKGVIIQDFADPAELLAPPNVNTDKLLDYAREAAEFSTKYQMPNLEFAVNHYGKPDVAMFDFTSMFAAETSCRVLVRKNYRLLQCLVGDSLLEPFWPTGSGCARGFLSSMDSAYAIKLWANTKNSILGVLAQRESIYRLLAQTTPENLHRDIGAYTVDPATRYPNLNRSTVNVWQVKHLVDTDDELILEQTFMDTNAIQAVPPEIPTRRKRRSGDTQPLSTVLLRWIKAQLHGHEFSHKLTELSECFTGGNVLCALINRYRPDLVDLNALKDCSPMECNEVAFKILESELNIPRIMSAKVSLTLENIDSKIWLNYLEQICEVFRGEIPHVKHPKLDFAKLKEKSSSNNAPDFSNLLKLSTKKAKSPLQDIDMTNVAYRGRSVLDEEKLKRQRKAGLESNPVPIEVHKRAKKRRSHEKSGNIEERQQRLQEIEANRMDRQSRRRLQRFKQTQNFYKSLHMLQAESFLRESDESSPFEDYSIYMYRQQAPEFNDRVKELERKLLHRDKDRGNQSALPRGTDEHFSDRIKSMEQRITSRNAGGVEKKPKDLLRAIGKIESSDWNIREIEKKIEQSKRTEIGKSKEKVPKWSKEQFVARQNKMSKPDRQESVEEKFKEIDQTLKNLDKQLKEGSVLEVGERGKNKVASIAGQFGKKEDTSEEKSIPIQKSPSKVGLVFNKQPASEKCHFCRQTVYVMEKISTEGLILHRSCLKCHHCHTNLRLGGYAFDRDDPVGRFYCTQHFRLPAKAERPVARRAPGEKRPHYQIPITKDEVSTPARGRPDNVAQLDLLDRGQTPERIEFENVDAMSDGEPSLENIIDENEWTDRNFITGSEESESDLSSSDSSDEESDSDIFEEANGSPIGAQTLQLATDWIGKQRYSNIEDSDEEDFYDSSEGLLDDDAESQTEGEEFKKAREMRRQEVKLMPPPAYLPTDTETEVVSIADSQQTNIDNKNGDTINLKIDSDTNLNAIINDLVLPNTERRVEGPSKTDIQILERNLERKVSTEIDALNENLYNLNNLIKLNKEVVTLKRQNSVKDDIMKKLSLKEKWLNDTDAGNLLPANQNLTKEVVDNIIEDVKNVDLGEEGKDIDTRTLDMGQDLQKSDERKEDEKKEEITIEKKKEEIKVNDKKGNETENVNQRNRRRTISDIKTSVVGDKKNEESELQKQFELRRHSFRFPSDKEVVTPAVNKSYEGSELQKKFEQRRQSLRTPSDTDVGKLLYNAESKPPKHEENMTNALKNIEVKNFSDTMDTIKSLITTPKVSKQSSVDISKYFPNQKLEKSASVAKNVNQKTLKDVDLSKYFPKSPEPKRKGGTVPTVASKMSPSLRRKSDVLLTKNGTDSKSESKLTTAKSSGNVSKDDNKKPPKPKANVLNKPTPKRNALAPNNKAETTNGNGITKSDSDLDIFDQLLDGAMDIKAVKNSVTNKSPKIERKSKNDGSTTKKKKASPSPNSKFKKKDGIEKVLDANEQIFEEILQTDEVRSPSVEYQKLFNEEKSPSTDLSDRIEQILIDNNATPSNPKLPLRKKKLAKQSKNVGNACEINGNKITTNQNESTSNQSCPSLDENPSKILRKSQLIPSTNDVAKGKDLNIDFEKTMEYLKTEWRKEAEHFLQKKKDQFYAKRRGEQISDSEEEDFGEHIINQPYGKKLENVQEEEGLSDTDEILNGIIDDMQKETANESVNEFIEDILVVEKENMKISNNSVEMTLSDSQETLVGSEVKLNTDHENNVERNDNIMVVNVEDGLHEKTIPATRTDLIDQTTNEKEDSVKVQSTTNQTSVENVQNTINEASNESSEKVIDEVGKDADMGNKVERDNKEKVQSNKVDKILHKTINVVNDITSKGLNILCDLMATSDTTPLNISSCVHKENEKKNDDFQFETLKQNVETKRDILDKSSPIYNKPENNISKNVNFPGKSSSSLDHSVKEKDAPENASLDVKIDQGNPISAESSSKENQNYSIQFNKVMAELGNMSKLLKETKRPIIPKRVKKAEKQSLDSDTKDVAKVEECKNDQKINGNGSIILDNIPKVDEKQKLPVAEKPESKNKQNKPEVDSDDSLLSDIELNDLEVDQLINEIMHEFGEIKESDKEVLIDELLNETVEVNPLKLPDEMVTNPFTVNTESACEYSNTLKEKSSSEDSIEKLFNQFTDDMLVDVEFDSNDEIISIIPKGKVAKEEGDLIRKTIPGLNEKIVKDSFTYSPDVDTKSDLLVTPSVENNNNDTKCTLSEGRMSKENNNSISEITSSNTENVVNKPISLCTETDIKPQITDLPESSKNEIASTTSKNNLSKEEENIINESIVSIHRNTMDGNIICEGDTSNKNHDLKEEHAATVGNKSNSPKSDVYVPINKHHRNSKYDILSKDDEKVDLITEKSISVDTISLSASLHGNSEDGKCDEPKKTSSYIKEDITPDSKIDIKSISSATSPLFKNSAGDIDRQKNNEIGANKSISPSSNVSTKSVSPNKILYSKIDNTSTSSTTSSLHRNSVDEIDRKRDIKTDAKKSISPSSDVNMVSPIKIPDSKIDITSTSSTTSPLDRNNADEINGKRDIKTDANKSISPSSNVSTKSVSPNKILDSKIDNTSTSSTTSSLHRNSVDEIDRKRDIKTDAKKSISPSSDVNMVSPIKIPDSKIDITSTSSTTSPLDRNNADEINGKRDIKTDANKSISPSSNVSTKSDSPNKIPDSKIDNTSTSSTISPLHRNSVDEIDRKKDIKTDANKSISPSSNVSTKSVSPNKILDSKIDNTSTSSTTLPLHRNSVDEIDRKRDIKTDANKSISPSSNVSTKSVSPNKIPDSKIDNTSTSSTISPLHRNSVDEIDRKRDIKTDANKSISPSSNVSTKSVSPNKILDSKIDNTSTSSTTSPLHRNSVDEIDRKRNIKTDANKSISPSSNVSTKSVSPNKISDSKVDNTSTSSTTSPLHRNSVDEIDRKRNNKTDSNKSISPSSDVSTKAASPIKISHNNSNNENLKSANETSPTIIKHSETIKNSNAERENIANKSFSSSTNVSPETCSPIEISRDNRNDESESLTKMCDMLKETSNVTAENLKPLTEYLQISVTPDSKIDTKLVSSNTTSLQKNSVDEIISITSKIVDPKEVSEVVRENIPEINKINAVKSTSSTPDVDTKSCSPIKALVSNIKDEVMSLPAKIDKPTETSDVVGEYTKSTTENTTKDISDVHFKTVSPIRPLRKNDISFDAASSTPTEYVLKENKELVSESMSLSDTKVTSKSPTSSPEIDSKSLYPIKPLRKYDRTVDIDKKNDEIVSANSSGNSSRQHSELSRRSTPPINEKVSIDSNSENLESNSISPVDESNIENKTTSICNLLIEKNDKIRESTSPINNNEINETMPILDDNSTSNFPIKPLRRNKSTTSSTSPEPPNPPTRGRRLSQKLNPTDMPPSVQDILRNIENNSEKTYFINLIDETTQKFPIMKDEEEDALPPEETKPKTLPRTKRSKSREKEPLTELEYIERLEMERREALIKRDEMYASLNKPINLTYAEVLKENFNDRVNYSGQGKKYYSSPSIVPKQYSENNSNRDFISVNPVNKSNDTFEVSLGHSSYIKEKTISSSPVAELPSTKMRIKRQYSEENPRREIISSSPINSFNKETHVSADSIFSPSKSILSRSSEQIPHRSYQRISNPMDRGTQILLDRSKMLHSMKEDFMTEKNAGNNPYLKKMLSTEKVCPDVEEYIIQNKPRDERPRQHFPTSRSIESKRYLNRTPEFSTSTNFNRPHSLASSAQSPRNFVEYFKKSPSHHKDRGRSKDSCVVQSDSESSSADGVELNSATEISTDSEFDHDPIIREAPRIFIDDTHLRKPTKVQVKQGIITSSPNHKVTTTNNQIQTALKQQEIEFKPLVQVDPSLLNSNRMPLKNPRPGDYLLNKTPSTEGIASKKSLELKKRYLLGEQGIGNGIMKSGSTSILDSKFKNFHSNISECQKLLNPGSDISPSMKTFLDRTKIGDKIVNKSEFLKKDIDEKENVLKNNINNKNKGKDYSETVNTALVENISKEMKTPVIIETIDLTTPEKSVPIIDLTTIDIPSTMVKANQEFIEKLEIAENVENDVIVIEDSPVKKEVKSLDEQDAVEKNDSCEKPDISKDVKEVKPDIITQIEETKLEKEQIIPNNTVQASPIKDELKPLCPTTNENDVQETSIEVPNIPWNINKTKSDVESDSLSSSSSSLEDIPHFILDSTTSPDTHNEQIVPRVEIHDTSGALMQIDSLMIIDGKYIGDPEDLKHMEIPAGTKIELPKEKPQETLVMEEIKETLMSSPSKPDLKFDTKNENKIDTLKNLPLLIEQNNENAKLVKPTTLELNKTGQSSFSSDKDKTPTAEHVISDSETEVTGQVLTETELSDWTADDVVSENFVDIEFALNSNKGTIKRNKKGRKKHLPKIQHLQYQQQSPPAPPKILDSPKDCGILRNLDIEEIEFMDTGSEGSCAEAYAATNKAMLQNRGYIEFIENTPPPSIPLQVAENEIKSLRAEIYSSNAESTSKEILGVDYIEQGACILSNDIDLKTPVNEIPSIFTLKQPQTQSQLPSTMTDSINDIDDDSLALINSQGATNTTTTEDSDALTVVTSPCEPGPKNLDNQNTPSSSEKNDKTISSSGTKIPVRKTSGDEIRRRTQEDNNKRKDSDELSYEEYVRKLQMKITQISNARDSIDVRKQKRKSSKGEVIENTQNNSVIENKSLSIFEPPKGTMLNTSNNNQAQQVHKVPEIPTLTRKLEEITKERTKQKDLIHDLVMDKLQSKKQLNAEKRLNRSRNRNMFNCSGIGVPSTPKVASNGCTNSPHYHITCSDRRSSKENLQKNQSIVKPKNSPKENKDFIQSFKNSPRSKQRPLSDNLDQIISFDQTPKLSKTRSFCIYNTGAIPTKDSPTDQRNPFFATPLPPPRISKKLDDPPSSANTDKLRADARARARLKSNQELGLSPEEKLQLLRKRYHIELHEVTDGGSSKNKSDDLKARDRKMVTSKSVNDISAVHTHLNSDENFDTKPVMPLGDFTSDPNLSQGNQTKTSRRRKDPERRKSLIQTVSNFFNKKKEKELSSPAKEKPEGVFSRFRISPKTKEKSKEKEGLSFDGISSQDCLKYEVTSYSSSPQLCKTTDDTPPPPIPPLPLNYQRSDDESYTTESREQKKQRAISKASRQAELKRLRIAQEIQREQEEIEVKLKELEARGVLIEKALRGEGQNMENIETSSMGANDEKLLKELLEICRNTTQLKKRDEELGIRQQELQLEHRHAQLKEELNIRLSYSKLDKSSADVAAEGAILNEMLEIVAKRAALRPNETGDLQAEDDPDV